MRRIGPARAAALVLRPNRRQDARHRAAAAASESSHPRPSGVLRREPARSCALDPPTARAAERARNPRAPPARAPPPRLAGEGGSLDGDCDVRRGPARRRRTYCLGFTALWSVAPGGGLLARPGDHRDGASKGVSKVSWEEAARDACRLGLAGIGGVSCDTQCTSIRQVPSMKSL